MRSSNTGALWFASFPIFRWLWNRPSLRTIGLLPAAASAALTSAKVWAFRQPEKNSCQRRTHRPVQDGKLVEAWNSFDYLAVYRQLGLLPRGQVRL